LLQNRSWEDWHQSRISPISTLLYCFLHKSQQIPISIRRKNTYKENTNYKHGEVAIGHIYRLNLYSSSAAYIQAIAISIQGGKSPAKAFSHFNIPVVRYQQFSPRSVSPSQMYIANMGICVSKDFQKAVSPTTLTNTPAKPAIRSHLMQKLLDLRKTRNAPLLSLDENLLYVKRMKALREAEEALSAEEGK